MKTVKIALTESQREQVQSLLDDLKGYPKTGKLGVSVGQLDGTYFEFTHAVFSVIDPIGAPKIHAAINGEVRRMKAEEADAASAASASAIQAGSFMPGN
jgi:hypothetical protein